MKASPLGQIARTRSASFAPRVSRKVVGDTRAPVKVQETATVLAVTSGPPEHLSAHFGTQASLTLGAVTTKHHRTIARDVLQNLFTWFAMCDRTHPPRANLAPGQVVPSLFGGLRNGDDRLVPVGVGVERRHDVDVVPPLDRLLVVILRVDDGSGGEDLKEGRRPLLAVQEEPLGDRCRR